MTNRPRLTYIIVWCHIHAVRLLAVIAMFVVPFGSSGAVATPKAYAALGEAISAPNPHSSEV